MAWREAAIYRIRETGGEVWIANVRYDAERNVFTVLEYEGIRDASHLQFGERIVFYLGKPGSRHKGFRATITGVGPQPSIPEEDEFTYQVDKFSR